MALLEDQLRPLVEAESSLLVDIMYHPHLLFAPESENRKRASNGGFIKKYINVLLFLSSILFSLAWSVYLTYCVLNSIAL